MPKAKKTPAKKKTSVKAPKPLLRRLTREDVVIKVHAEDEHIPVRGNVMASGDADFDRKCEDEIIERLNDGDEWAWACVKVTVTEPTSGLSADDYLGCCTYKDEAEFRKDGYFDDMVSNCMTKLQKRIDLLFDRLTEKFSA